MSTFERPHYARAMSAFIVRYYYEGTAPTPEWFFEMYERIAQLPESETTTEYLELEARVRAGEFDARVLKEYGVAPNPPDFRIPNEGSPDPIFPKARVDDLGQW